MCETTLEKNNVCNHNVVIFFLKGWLYTFLKVCIIWINYAIIFHLYGLATVQDNNEEIIMQDRRKHLVFHRMD